MQLSAMENQPPDQKSAKKPGSRFASFLNWAAAVFVLASVGQEFYFWELCYQSPETGGVFSPAFFLMMLLDLLWLVFFVLGVVFALWKFKPLGYKSLAPIAILAIPLLAPFLNLDGATLWLKYNHRSHATQRAEFVQKLRATKEIKTSDIWAGGYLAEPQPKAHLGTEIHVKQVSAGLMVLFQTWSGIPDGFSGFIYSVDGIDPKTEWPELELEWSSVWDETDNVYFVGNR